MLNLSNVLSLSRAGLALAFLQENPIIRFFAILLAMASDFLDGYLARRQGTASQFGAILDPIMDKFFVLFAGGIFYVEGRLPILSFAALLSRDLSICLFGLYLWLAKEWKDYECKAIFWGKISTGVQFFVLIGLTFGIYFSTYLYSFFVLMAAFAFLELLAGLKKRNQSTQTQSDKE